MTRPTNQVFSLPSGKNRRLLNRDQLPVEIRYVRDRIYYMGLGVYRDDFGKYWVGHVAADAHEHDRWLLYGNGGYKMGSFTFRWYVVQAETQKMVLLSRNVTAVIETCRRMLDNMTIWRKNQAYADIELGRLLLLSRVLRLSELSEPRHPEILPDLSQLHDMLYHFEQWSVNNPAAAGITQDIVLRMHGFGTLAHE